MTHVICDGNHFQLATLVAMAGAILFKHVIPRKSIA